MRLTYIYHSGFAIEADGFAVLIDYFRDTSEQKDKGFVKRELLERPGPLYVLASHFHPDHFNPEVLEWKKTKEDIRYLFSKDILKRRRAGQEDAHYLKKGDTYADDRLKLKAFGSTDAGLSFFLEMEGKRIFHAGDLNNWHWQDEATRAEAMTAEKNYLRELEDIAREVDELDVAMFPVDPRMGTGFMRGAEQFVDRIPTRLFVPMHFWERPEEVVAFGPYAESRGSRYVLISVPGEGTDF